MNLSKLRKLPLKTQMPVIAGVVLVFGLFAIVMGVQQRQDLRSRASGTGGTGNCTTINASTDDLRSNGCYVPSGLNGSIFGNRNTIGGALGGSITGDENNIQGGANGGVIGSRNIVGGGLGMDIRGDDNMIHGGSNGSIFGNKNTIRGGLNGCIKGNYNEIFGEVLGGVEGIGNIIHIGNGGTGTCPPTPPTPTPTQIPTPTPTTIPNGTCADGIDNNQNELIDSGDPICHTDGNKDNPNSYDPKRNEVYPSVTPTRTPTPTPTRAFGTCKDGLDNNQNELIDSGDPICHTDGNQNNLGSYDPYKNEVGGTPTTGPTVTVAPGNTAVSLNLLLHGIGKGGDSANPNSGGNPSPRRTQRNVTVEVYNSQNQLILTKQGNVSFGAANGNFTGQVDLGTTIATGVYSVKVKTTQFLNTLVPGIQSLTQGTVNQLPATVLVNGDIDGNNTLNILDYNILMGCYSDFLPAPSCSTTNKPLADLDDDGDVNQYDYNLFLREITNRAGQ
jgi:hypothetical protein